MLGEGSLLRINKKICPFFFSVIPGPGRLADRQAPQLLLLSLPRREGPERAAHPDQHIPPRRMLNAPLDLCDILHAPSPLLAAPVHFAGRRPVRRRGRLCRLDRRPVVRQAKVARFAEEFGGVCLLRRCAVVRGHLAAFHWSVLCTKTTSHSNVL